MLSPCQPEIGTKMTALGLYPVTNFLGDFNETSIAVVWWLSAVHFVTSNNHLFDAKCVSQEYMRSFVCPFLEIPASNSPVSEATINTRMHALLSVHSWRYQLQIHQYRRQRLIQECTLFCLSILGDTSFKFTSIGGNV